MFIGWSIITIEVIVQQTGCNPCAIYKYTLHFFCTIINTLSYTQFTAQQLQKNLMSLSAFSSL